MNEITCKFEVENNLEAFLQRFNGAVDGWLEECKNDVATQAGELSPVETGDLRRSFTEDSYVDTKEKTAWIGSHLEYSIWVEYGTGEWALYGNGRKGGWTYFSEKDGEFHHTIGRKPARMLYKALKIKQPQIYASAKAKFGIK